MKITTFDGTLRWQGQPKQREGSYRNSGPGQDIHPPYLPQSAWTKPPPFDMMHQPLSATTRRPPP